MLSRLTAHTACPVSMHSIQCSQVFNALAKGLCDQSSAVDEVCNCIRVRASPSLGWMQAASAVVWMRIFVQEVKATLVIFLLG